MFHLCNIIQDMRSSVNFEKLQKTVVDESWTEAEIAKRTGISKYGVQKILKGETEPRASNLKRICDAIGLPIEQAFLDTLPS